MSLVMLGNAGQLSVRPIVSGPSSYILFLNYDYEKELRLMAEKSHLYAIHSIVHITYIYIYVYSVHIMQTKTNNTNMTHAVTCLIISTVA